MEHAKRDEPQDTQDQDRVDDILKKLSPDTKRKLQLKFGMEEQVIREVTKTLTSVRKKVRRIKMRLSRWFR